MTIDNVWARATICVALVMWADTASARGVSPYLPLNLSPRIERQIERVLILADQVVVRRPIAAAVVQDALPKACKIDADLCTEVGEYLSRYMHNAGISNARVETSASTGDSDVTMPNAHGMTVSNPWQVSGAAYFQPSDYALFSLGGIAYRGRATPTGTVLSFGRDFAQLDLGFRDHWFSPMTDSSSLISTEAPTMPSVTLSNYDPIGPFGINYEVFLAQMSRSDRIEFEGGLTSGKPRIAGTQLGIEPTNGYSFSAARTFQFGGGPRGGSGASALIHAFLDPTHYDQIDRLGNKLEFGNQMASIAATVTAPTKVPFVVRMEYAAEDTGYSSYLIARSNLTLGLEFPLLFNNFDFGVEASEWQDSWYVHHIYQDGYRNYGNVIGHWFGDYRLPQDDPWGRSLMLRGGWHLDSGSEVQVKVRNLDYYFIRSGFDYSPSRELGLSYSSVRGRHLLDLGLFLGQDVFGEKYIRATVAADLLPGRRSLRGSVANGGRHDGSDVEIFVDAGVSKNRLSTGWGLDVVPVHQAATLMPHVGIGVRRPVTDRSDIGMRLELDKVGVGSLLSVRALDYRYHLGDRIYVNGFMGVSRYAEQLPMYGFYWGWGVGLANVMPGWDFGIVVRKSDKVMRAKVLPTDVKQDINPNYYADIKGLAAILSRKF